MAACGACAAGRADAAHRHACAGDADDADYQVWIGAFQQALAYLGWNIGRNVRIDGRASSMARTLLSILMGMRLQSNSDSFVSQFRLLRQAPSHLSACQPNNLPITRSNCSRPDPAAHAP
jgi:hypothetical protein